MCISTIKNRTALGGGVLVAKPARQSLHNIESELRNIVQQKCLGLGATAPKGISSLLVEKG